MEAGQLAPESSQQNLKLSPFIVASISLFFLSIISSFVGGYYFHKTLEPSIKLPITPSITATNTPTGPEVPQTNTNFIKDKQFFDDTIFAVTTDIPHKIMIATVSRQENEKGAYQSTRASYFDGEKWIRKTTLKQYDSAAIYTNNIVTKWDVEYDKSRVLKQKVHGSVRIGENSFDFDTNILTNNIAMRSLPGYTKFLSNGAGTLNINGISTEAKILYSRIYSNNAKEIQFYDAPFDLTTYWLAFWDDAGNFYHVDSTEVPNPTDIYKTHQFGAMVDSSGRVSKTFEIKINTDKNNPPQSYEVEMTSPINQKISFKIHHSLDKTAGNVQSWFMSEGEGEVENRHIFGILEYIHN